MFCSNCGEKLRDTAKFCPSCGNAVKRKVKKQEPVKKTQVEKTPSRNFNLENIEDDDDAR